MYHSKFFEYWRYVISQHCTAVSSKRTPIVSYKTLSTFYSFSVSSQRRTIIRMTTRMIAKMSPMKVKIFKLKFGLLKNFPQSDSRRKELLQRSNLFCCFVARRTQMKHKILFQKSFYFFSTKTRQVREFRPDLESIVTELWFLPSQLFNLRS